MAVEFWGPEEHPYSTEEPLQLLDVTDSVARAVASWSIAAGSVQVYCPHTSCGLLVTEMEDGLHEDIAAALEHLAPRDRAYAHDDMARRHQPLAPDERKNGWTHVRAMLATQPSVVLPVVDGALDLGRYQRLFLVELDGPRPARRLVIQGWGRDRAGGDHGGPR